MEIIMLVPNLPYPPNSGGRIRIFELLCFLQHRHRVTLVTFILDQAEQAMVEEVMKICHRVIAVPRPRQRFVKREDPLPWRITEFWLPEMQDVLQKIDKKHKFDLVIVEHIFMAQYACYIHAPAVLQEHNIESQVQRRYAEVVAHYQGERPVAYTVGGEFREAQTEWIKMALYEDSMWPQFPIRVTVSDLDREEMLRRCPQGHVVTVPNGVNLKEFSRLSPLEEPNVLFVGTMGYQPNIDAAFELCDVIWPMIRRQIPKACLYIIGREPPAELLKRHQPGCIEIVSDAADIEIYAMRCSVSAVPLRVGGGTRIKILTSMALGIPVVSTKVGYEGLKLAPERDLLVADEPVQFAQRLVHLLLHKERRMSLARSGRLLVETHYDWQNIFPILERAYEEVLSGSLP